MSPVNTAFLAGVSLGLGIGLLLLLAYVEYDEWKHIIRNKVVIDD